MNTLYDYEVCQSWHCDNSTDDGEGYDGYCGTCADALDDADNDLWLIDDDVT